MLTAYAHAQSLAWFGKPVEDRGLVYALAELFAARRARKAEYANARRRSAYAR